MTTTTWGVPFMSGSLDDVRKHVALMRELGIRSLTANGIHVELEPVPRQIVDVDPVEKVAGVFEEATGSICSCGHSWVTEHSDSGCLMGCSHDLCNSTGSL